MNEIQKIEQLERIDYRDVRNQLTKNIDFGTNYPIAEIEVKTREIGVLPNTETILYSKVSYNTAEEIYIPHPQEDTTYELVELNPLIEYEPVGVEGKAMSLPHGSSVVQPVLVLKTPKISEFERTFSIRATSNHLGLERSLDKVVKVQAGINENLEVHVDRNTINYDETITITILNGQADCEYLLEGITDTEGAVKEPISEPDYSIEARDVTMTSFPLKENLLISVYAFFRTSKRDGYLKQTISINVYPNPLVVIIAEEATLDYCSQESIDLEMPEVTAQIELKNTQASVSYQAFFVWVDPTIPPVPFESQSVDFQEADWGTSQLRGGVASDSFIGIEDQSLIIPLVNYLPEDVTVSVIASKNTYDGEIISNTLQIENVDSETQTSTFSDHEIRFFIYPSKIPSVEEINITVSKGDSATIRILNAQVGAYYWLFNQLTNEKIGFPHFVSKKRTIGLAKIGVDFSPSTTAESDDRIVEFITDPIHEETMFYVKVTKPINELELRFVDEITVKVNE